MDVPWKAAEKFANLYYPRSYASATTPQPAHFHGTYTTRYDAKKSNALNDVETQMNKEWVPKANR